MKKMQVNVVKSHHSWRRLMLMLQIFKNSHFLHYKIITLSLKSEKSDKAASFEGAMFTNLDMVNSRDRLSGSSHNLLHGLTIFLVDSATYHKKTLKVSSF
jgi:hypothetical protein